MKFRLLFLFSCLALGVLVLPANKNGRASQEKRGNTGAPGDETNVNGTAITCQNCHSAQTATLNIAVLDAAGAAVTQYVPGTVYTARVTVTATNPNLTRYGFQMIALRDSDNADLDGFSDQNPNNYKIATIQNGRTYAEHDNSSQTNTFDVRWTAPVAGTGNVKFYASGNAVNNNGLSSGDAAGFTSLALSESGSVANHEINALTIDAMQVSPNPARHNFRLSAQLPEAGQYRLSAWSAATGKMIWSQTAYYPSGSFQENVLSAAWPSGAYMIRMEKSSLSASVKVLKL